MGTARSFTPLLVIVLEHLEQRAQTKLCPCLGVGGGGTVSKGVKIATISKGV